MPFTHSAGPALNIDSPSSEPSTSATKPGSPSTPSLTLVTGSGWMRAVVALIDLDRPAIWVGYDEAASPLGVLVTAEHLDPKPLQRRHHRIQRGHPQADKRAAGSTPSARDPRGGGRQYGYVHGAHLARSVNVTITVVLVFERNAERSIERHGLLEVLGEDDDRRHLSHGDLSCHALFQPTISGRSARPPPDLIPSLAQRVIADLACYDVRHGSDDEWGLDLRNLTRDAVERISLHTPSFRYSGMTGWDASGFRLRMSRGFVKSSLSMMTSARVFGSTSDR